MSDTNTAEEMAELRRSSETGTAADRIGIKSNASKVQENKFNPGFLAEIQDPKVDTERFEWIQDELGPVLSGAHLIGQRQEYYEQQQELLNQAKSEQIIAENNPGDLLQRHPNVLAVMQGVEGTNDPEFRGGVDQPKRRALRHAMEVATTRQALSVGGEGIKAFTTATTETRQVTNEQEEESNILSKAKGVVR
jgi:hypothetical protein